MPYIDLMAAGQAMRTALQRGQAPEVARSGWYLALGERYWAFMGFNGA